MSKKRTGLNLDQLSAIARRLGLDLYPSPARPAVVPFYDMDWKPEIRPDSSLWSNGVTYYADGREVPDEEIEVPL